VNGIKIFGERGLGRLPKMSENVKVCASKRFGYVAVIHTEYQMAG
jgi:hypothetical protein